MTDVSSTIIVGEWTLIVSAGIVIAHAGDQWLALRDNDARDLAQALKVWLERNAKVEASNGLQNAL